jgi:hypothetical protein
MNKKLEVVVREKCEKFAREIWGMEFKLPIKITGRMTTSLGRYKAKVNYALGLHIPVEVSFATKLFEEKRIDDTQEIKLKRLAEDEEKWYNKNAKTATEVDFSQEQLKINDTIINIIPDSNIRSLLTRELDNIKNLSTGDLTSLITKAEADIKQKKDFKKIYTTSKWFNHKK